jgi:lambda family phage minor tail protein L
MAYHTPSTQAFDAASHKLAVGALIELLTIDATGCFDFYGNAGAVHRFVSSKKSEAPFQFAGNIFAPWPIETTGWEHTSDTPPRPVVRLADAEGLLLATARRFGSLVNARVTRQLTTAGFAHTGQGSPLEIYNIARMSEADGTQIAFELTTSLELLNRKFPNRLMLRKATTEAESFPALGANKYRS